MFRFDNPQCLWLLVLLPILIIVRLMASKRHSDNMKRLGDETLIRQMTNGASKYRTTIKFMLMLLTLAAMILVMSRPQFGIKSKKVERAGIEAIIAMDISNSMLAEDVAPSRLEKSKLLVEHIADNLVNDKLGLIVYAGDAFVQLPITSDFVSARMFTESINPSMISSQGTDIASAVRLAMQSFTQNETGKAIILITDGEDHEGNVKEAVNEAYRKGVKLFVLGVGTQQGAPIETEDGNYMKDESGETVITRLNIDMCKEIAEAGHGKFIYVDNTTNAQKLLEQEIGKMQKGEAQSYVFDDYNEQFQAFTIIALLLLIIDTLILNRANNRRSVINMFTKRVIVVVFLLGLSTFAMAQTDRDYVRKGNKAYRKGDYINAEIAYRKALAKNNTNPQALYNMGCVYSKKKNKDIKQNQDTAVSYYKMAARHETDAKRRSLSYHNMGVIAQANKDYDKAISAYKDALRNNPGDNESRYNLIQCMKQQKNKQQQNDKNNRQNNNDKNKDKNKNKNKDKDKNNNNSNKDNKKDKQQPQMSKDNAQQLLRAAQREEEETQKRLQKALQNPSKRSLKKNW